MSTTRPQAPRRGTRPGRRASPPRLSEIEQALTERAAEISDALERGIPRTLGHRAADGLTRVGGSWQLVISLLAFIALWIAANGVVLAGDVDPFPFIFLNLIFSGLSATLAPIVLISQGRMEQIDRLRSTENFRTNLRAELQIAELHAKLDHLGGACWDQLRALEAAQREILDELLRRHRWRDAALTEVVAGGS
jgi:uncharacterized membrane protein